MYKIWFLTISVTIALASAAFCQEGNQEKYPVEFTTPDGQAVSVFAVVGQSSGLSMLWLGNLTGAITSYDTSLRPAIMAPDKINLPNGWYRFQIGESALFQKQFDVVIRGTAQEWQVSNGSPVLNAFGWVVYALGIGAATFGILSLADSYKPLLPSGTATAMTIGGLSGCVGGLIAVFSSYPDAVRKR